MPSSATLAPGRTAEFKWTLLRAGISRFAGRDLELDAAVLASERGAG
jgi:glutaminase